MTFRDRVRLAYKVGGLRLALWQFGIWRVFYRLDRQWNSIVRYPPLFHFRSSTEARG